jgi:5'-3' exonuclease
MEGICWTLLYYYRGCPSWTWYYPHHYAPFASDFVGLNEFSISFPQGTKPFKPFEQLMACLPPLSRCGTRGMHVFWVCFMLFGLFSLQASSLGVV